MTGQSVKIKLPFRVRRPMIAFGADTKGAFAIAKGADAVLVGPFGDLANPDNLAGYEEAISAYRKRFKIRPEVFACDLHPGYFSSSVATAYTLYAIRYPLLRIQHHEAHVASVMAENAVRGNCIGVAFDGTGYGSDGNIWGGEFFTFGTRGFRRAGHLEYIAMPGGQAAVREPWRMAVSWLYRSFGKHFVSFRMDLIKSLDKKKIAMLRQMIDKKINSPLTSSMGRLFDAASSLILNKKDAISEAALPIELESIASYPCEDKYGYDLKVKNGIISVDAAGIITGIVKDLAARRISSSVISAKFHNTVADMVVKVSMRLRKSANTDRVVLSGGVFSNKILLRRTRSILQGAGFTVYTSLNNLTGDVGIPLGQIAIGEAIV